MWPIREGMITLRVCADLGWQVTVGCPKCGVSTTIWPDKAPAALQAVPLHKLFADQAFKCKKVQYGCTGTPASRLTVDCMDVGMLKPVAKWERA